MTAHAAYDYSLHFICWRYYKAALLDFYVYMYGI